MAPHPASNAPTETITRNNPVPVCRPWAPPAASIAPYIERIDAARWYSNFGPLVRNFEGRIKERFNGETRIVTAVNGTLALALALRARAPRGGLCLMPAWTFVATAHAALLAGLTPYLADVDDATGALTPAIARRALERAPAPIAAIVPVLPFGFAGGVEAWAKFEEDCGIPIVIDAAAAFDTVNDATTPLVVSLHATKTLGIGEGGFLATQDQDLANKVHALSVFGFEGTRDSRMPAFNAKLSEYSAAVGMAALDHWPETRGRLLRVAQLIRAAFALSPEIRFQPGWGLDWVSTTCIVQLPDGMVDRAERRLANAGVETRRWWERGLHRQPVFRTSPLADDLSTVNRLAASTIGLPFSIDMTAGEIDKIARATMSALAEG